MANTYMSSNPFKILIIGEEWKTVPVSSINDSYSDLNLTKFMRKKDIQIVNAPIVAIPPSAIANKCIIIPISKEDEIVIENTIRFELD